MNLNPRDRHDDQPAATLQSCICQPLLQRRLSVGYSRASRMVEQMADAGILGDHVGSKARAVQISMEDWEQMKKMGSGINAANEFDDEAFDDDGEGVPGEYAGEYRG